jgi:hypothetical protein
MFFVESALYVQFFFFFFAILQQHEDAAFRFKDERIDDAVQVCNAGIVSPLRARRERMPLNYRRKLTIYCPCSSSRCPVRLNE